jgi:hypothetical protein
MCCLVEVYSPWTGVPVFSPMWFVQHEHLGEVVGMSLEIYTDSQVLVAEFGWHKNVA